MIVGVLVAAATPIISSASATPANIAGMVVFIDPGHNGANDASIGRQVPTGRGGTKNCQASGTSTNSGYPEHTFTWETGLRLRAALNALGVRPPCHVATTTRSDRVSMSAPIWPTRCAPTRS